MAFHVIYRDSDGAMWQSYEQANATPLPPGFSQPAGHSIKTFAGPPTSGQVWEPVTRTFVAALVGDKAIAKAEVDVGVFTHRLILRAVPLVIMDELNILRQSPTTTFAARIPSQIKTAIKNKIDTF